MFNTVTAKRIAILGFAFKKDTGDTRETAAAYVTKYLLEERASVVVYDPKVVQEEMDHELTYVGVDLKAANTQKDLSREADVYAACKGAHAIAICTEWDEFKTLDYARIYKDMVKPAFLFDGRNIIDHAKLRKIGFEVHAIGKHPIALE